MTTKKMEENTETCPVQGLLKLLSGKWKPEIFRLAVNTPLRFNTLLKQLEGANKQSLATALKELEESGLLDKIVIREKPLHIEYNLTEKGKSLIPVLEQLEGLI
ncbi:helix-turn-helix transcriptional regulator [Crocinitomicaceae bacterium CZZ-1]|uniref:Helix-turn-helix transcriptional regulator n=1 Tax=Taishania pollutisoli TaxID=2766479 RepID=A0A8J6P5J2_9FLAO|nr:helix-turn-helix domain-containing protein [Taishania pollutisoli]MBC9812244.1 helix-turn-helix transcriptional regulator [Taishania pollutisoli]MBX2950539.1 helix-turn-helix transcriptional regulator [Crocinitomicaceae bacterium]NGF74618.1 helix-turn-helix transcriptional regulator [Fluviicola sp. SGL-29]